MCISMHTHANISTWTCKCRFHNTKLVKNESVPLFRAPVTRGWVCVVAESGRQSASANVSGLVEMGQLCSRFATLETRGGKNVCLKKDLVLRREAESLGTHSSACMLCSLMSILWAFSELSPRASKATYHPPFMKQLWNDSNTFLCWWWSKIL